MIESILATVGLFMVRVGLPLLALIAIGARVERAYNRHSA
jgi:hypothetical protein